MLVPSLSMDLPMQGSKEAESGPKGVQMQQTDLPAGYNMFPEGAIIILRPRNSLLALHAINFHEQFNPMLTEAVGHLSILSSRTWIKAYLSFHYIPCL